LTTQLDDLVKAKKSHQDEMLRKFAALLNTKKLKIRDQQRLLAHAKVDPGTADQVQQARSGTDGRKPDLSRSSKRKADTSSHEPETDDEDFEQTDLGNRINQEPSNFDKSDLDTEDDDSDGGFAPASMPSQSLLSRSQVSVGTRGKALETTRKIPSRSPEIQLPPRRQLPFSKTSQPESSSQNLTPSTAATIAPSKPLPTMDDDNETDDEL
jgi:hypothetical protein